MSDNNIKTRTVFKSGSGEVVEKKSRFLSFLIGVNSEEEIEEILGETRKKYWDARHVCYAYVLGRHGEVQRYSDDGEPQKTAGKPMLDVLTGAELTGVMMVVVRYFGGVLLGTGGLVRAYTGAARAALDNAVIISKIPSRMLTVTMDYTSIGKILYLLKQENIPIGKTMYLDNVVLCAPVAIERYEEIKTKILDATGGAVDMGDGDELEYAIVDGEIVYL